MAPTSKPYTRLTRDTSGVGTYTSLWLAADHLMLVTGSGVSENYARFDLRDIQGFFVTPSQRRVAWAVWWGVLFAISLVAFVSNLSGNSTPVFSTFFLLISLGALVGNHLLSQGCAVYVVTGVQTTRLPALCRRRQARRILARLEPAIRAAQADLIPAVPAAAPAAPAEAAPAPVPPPANPPSSTA
jgi:hypothetical protein